MNERCDQDDLEVRRSFYWNTYPAGDRERTRAALTSLHQVRDAVPFSLLESALCAPPIGWRYAGPVFNRHGAEAPTLRAHSVLVQTTRPPISDPLTPVKTKASPRPLKNTRANSARVVSALWDSGKHDATLNELQSATGLTREQVDAACEYLVAHPRPGAALTYGQRRLLGIPTPDIGQGPARRALDVNSREHVFVDRIFAMPYSI